VSDERAKTMLETASDEELAEHLGYDKHDPLGRNRRQIFGLMIIR
jgi:transposase-like protein